MSRHSQSDHLTAITTTIRPAGSLWRPNNTTYTLALASDHHLQSLTRSHRKNTRNRTPQTANTRILPGRQRPTLSTENVNREIGHTLRHLKLMATHTKILRHITVFLGLDR